jgi:hypothetical protein
MEMNTSPYNTYGITFECDMIEYEKLPKKELVNNFQLRFDYTKRKVFVRSNCGRFLGKEKPVSYPQAKEILEHICSFGLN